MKLEVKLKLMTYSYYSFSYRPVETNTIARLKAKRISSNEDGAAGLLWKRMVREVKAYLGFLGH